jgi:hypothetical protein
MVPFLQPEEVGPYLLRVLGSLAVCRWRELGCIQTCLGRNRQPMVPGLQDHDRYLYMELDHQVHSTHSSHVVIHPGVDVLAKLSNN